MIEIHAFNLNLSLIQVLTHVAIYEKYTKITFIIISENISLKIELFVPGIVYLILL